MRIITISRQFGSGGRELGKRLADELGWDYYDREIIEELANRKGMDPDYVSHIISDHSWHSVALNYRNSFNYMTTLPSNRAQLLVLQREIVEEIAAAGHDCIIVGRDADIILRDYNPFRILVCADMQSRVDRCMRFENKKENGRLTEKEIKRNIRRIDQSRSRVRELLTGRSSGDSTSFDMTINAASWNIKALASAVAVFAVSWFENHE